MRNLTQSTYDRIKRNAGRTDADSWGRSKMPTQDVRDLLEAYESAAALLEAIAFNTCECDSAEHRAAEDFLFHESGEPRVELDIDEELSYSSRGLLRPADSDDYEP